MKKLLASMAIFLLPVAGFAQYTNVIDFGDSLADSGNPYLTDKKGNNNWVQFCIHRGSWCSKDNPLYLLGAPIVNKTPDFSNQRANWVNYFDKSYGYGTVMPYRIYHNVPKQYMNLSTQNLSFAYASSESYNRYVDDLHPSSPTLPYNPYNNACKSPSNNPKIQNSCVPGLYSQIDLYKKMFQSAGIANTDEHTLYFIWSGGNGIFDNIGKLAVLVKQKKFASLLVGLAALHHDCVNGNKHFVTFGNTTLSCPANNVAYSVKYLVDSGVNPHDIVVFNMANIANTPAAYHLSGGNKMMLKLFQGIANQFNQNLAHMLDTLGLKRVRIFDTYALLDAIMHNLSKYHFSTMTKQTQMSCVGQHGGSAEDCYAFIWYNEKHPSAHTGKCIANSLNLFISGKDPITNLKC